MSVPRIAIIGAGVSGLSAAQKFNELGYHIVVFDKARGPGGRLCTRRSDSGGFDHGAPYFKADATRIQPWIDQGIIAPWNGRFGRVESTDTIHKVPANDRWVGIPKMSTIGRWMAQRLDAHMTIRIDTLEGKPGHWTLVDTKNQRYGPFDFVLLTCPGPQAAAILPQDSHLYTVAKQLSYSVCWATMLDYDSDLEMPWDALEFEKGPIAQALRSKSKPGRSSLERWVLHAQADWSDTHREYAPEWVGCMMENTFRPVARLAASRINVHRWLYARSHPTQTQKAVIDHDWALGLCGDGLSGGGVLEAIESGEYLAQLVIKTTG